ncbi:hypothetical protein E1263_03850 [Kribbella antibiotica]|uniref:DoxX family membrane protein n=1 Tax=Kribbella antibiotica TaxID=190195 RepID=A0A4R4ZYM5_9ACTN|nr:hypothetical protein [Kribbella antibiotica]TDD62302.1 hypothetical protein E1263_03850 [Kribbella antibiotica]
MIVLVLLLATAGVRGLGALGVRRFADWRTAAAHGMAVMLLFTASAHFVPATVTVMPTHDDLVAMVPPFVPYADGVVYLTGVLELMGAAGLVLTATRRAAAAGLALLFVSLLPANIYAAIADVSTASPLWQRIPEQLLYIAAALYVAGRIETKKEVHV